MALNDVLFLSHTLTQSCQTGFALFSCVIHVIYCVNFLEKVATFINKFDRKFVLKYFLHFNHLFNLSTSLYHRIQMDVTSNACVLNRSNVCIVLGISEITRLSTLSAFTSLFNPCFAVFRSQ